MNDQKLSFSILAVVLQRYFYQYHLIAGIIFVVLVAIFLTNQSIVGKVASSSCVRGDLNSDGVVDAVDLDVMISTKDGKIASPTKLCCADFDNNNVVNEIDYDMLFNAFLEGKSLGAC